jgi:hypothetical protein
MIEKSITLTTELTDAEALALAQVYEAGRVQ